MQSVLERRVATAPWATTAAFRLRRPRRSIRPPVGSPKRSCWPIRVLPSGLEGKESTYSCQATRMYEATRPLAWWDVRQYVFDVVTGNRSLGRVLRVLLLAWHSRRLLPRVPIGYRFFERFHDRMHLWQTGRPSPSLNGRIPNGAQTPTGQLQLKPGESVRIKTQMEIEQTINQEGQESGPHCSILRRWPPTAGAFSRCASPLRGSSKSIRAGCCS